MQAILIGFEQYLISQADHTKREHERMNDSIRQMVFSLFSSIYFCLFKERCFYFDILF